MNNNYTEKTYEEIFLNALQDAFQEALISHDEEFQSYIKNNHIAVDCGAVFEDGRLGCICLDTMKEYYV